MKKGIVLILSAVMLFTAVPMRADAACDHCGHSEVNLSGPHWESAGYGYTHYYTTKDGKPGGCVVTVIREYYAETCRNSSCGFVRKIYTGSTDERHEKPEHN